MLNGEPFPLRQRCDDLAGQVGPGGPVPATLDPVSPHPLKPPQAARGPTLGSCERPVWAGSSVLAPEPQPAERSGSEVSERTRAVPP